MNYRNIEYHLVFDFDVNTDNCLTTSCPTFPHNLKIASVQNTSTRKLPLQKLPLS